MSQVRTKNGEAKIERYLSAETKDPFEAILYILSQRWTPQIIRHLLKKTLRFNELLRAVGANPCTLRERLKELEAAGIVDRNVISEMPPYVEYSLTEKGKDMKHIFKSLENWSRRWG